MKVIDCADIEVRKKCCDVEYFSIAKVKRSLLLSGVSKETVDSLLDELLPRLYSGITTKKIESLAYSLLKKRAKKTAYRYGLKTAISKLGPNGYFFEKFVSHMFSKCGYDVSLDFVAKGKCVTHQVDVLVKKEGRQELIECKFHNKSHIKNDVKVSLYIKARWDDIRKENSERYEHFWLVSNTKFTKDARQFANCSGLKLLTMHCERGDSIQSLVVRHDCYPISSIKSLTKEHLYFLLQHDVILVAQLSLDLLRKCRMNEKQYLKVLKEYNVIMGVSID